MLDVGTGSGILAIAAAKRGAREVLAVDTDIVAVRAAGENAKLNGAEVVVALGSAADAPGVFDVVIANIVGPVLVAIAADLRACLATPGTLVLAGITREAAADVRDAFDAMVRAPLERDARESRGADGRLAELSLVRTDEAGDWVSLVYAAR